MELTSERMQRYFIELQYNGRDYYGWQIQPGKQTIQSELNEKLSILLKEKILTTGAGRTDAGVHAEFFVAHFDISKPILIIDQLIYKMNRFLSRDIRILSIYKVDKDKHARFDAVSRTYQYYITTVKNVFKPDLYWYIPYSIDIELMNKACEILMQYNDFTSFSKVGTKVKTNNCTIMSALWSKQNDLLIFSITADRFLRNMVRAIVGTMINIGRHKNSLNDLRNIIEHRDRSKAGESVPANGLFLWDIKYKNPV